jgi:hypothetical protein
MSCPAKEVDQMLLDLGFFAKILNINENLGKAFDMIFEEEE